MAKIVEDVIVIKFSKIVKDSDNHDTVIIDDENIAALEQVAQELAGTGAIVEAVRA
jgi:hypothetical protein